MTTPGQRSTKGQRHYQQIIDAALRCLARDGYAATSIQRVADEAGLGKRTVLYYYGTREELFAHVGRHLGERLMQQTAEAIDGLEDPADIIPRAFGRIWNAVITDRGLQVAWLGLLTESITNPSLRETTAEIAASYRTMIGTLIDDALARGRVLTVRRESLELIILAGLQGLVLEYLEHGETPELAAAIEDFQQWLLAASRPARNSTNRQPTEH